MNAKALPLYFEKTSNNAFRPTKGSIDAAGYDLYSAYNCVIPKNGRQLIMTDIIIAIPKGCYGRIAPRSGLALRHSIDVGAGVIDRDYRGTIAVLLLNNSKDDFKISRGERVAQLIIELTAETELIEAKLDVTQRGEDGFGSTGD